MFLRKYLFKKSKTVLEKKKTFVKLFEKLSKLYTEIYDEDSEFDTGCKIVAGLGRIQTEVEDMKNEIEKEFDFRNLKFENYHLENDTYKSERDVWFVKDDDEDDSIHIYQPEFVNIEEVRSDNYRYIIIVEILKDCQHYKTMVLNAKTWISDTEDLGIEQNMEDFSDYILKHI